MSETKALNQKKKSETRDHISVHINKLLHDLPDSPYKPSIFRVHDDLHCVNEKLYEPKLLAVGPYHHRKNHLRKMQQHKLQYLKLLLKRRDESSVDRYVMAIGSLEEKARGCYAEPIDLSPDDFVQMLLLDGIFIIELIRKYACGDLRRDDTIFQHEQVFIQLRHDLMLVENQVPFFVLEKLFSMTKSGNPPDDIFSLIRRFFDYISPWPDASKNTGEVSMENIDHLLGLVYKIWCSSFAETSRPDKERKRFLAINCTTELQEAGIKFSKCTESNCLDIKFTKGEMTIPTFDVSDGTELILRNLIAYEHFFIDKHTKYVTDYVFFWDCLINSSKDVEILRRRGIVTHLLGDDEMVCRMFNSLGKNTVLSYDFFYDDVFTMVREHCGSSWNRWMANLRHNYFNSPWAFISFFAALVLLVFAFTQTLFSVLSYFR